jgi:outer membrane protein TolC
MKAIYLLFGFICAKTLAQTPDTITLDHCQQQAAANYPSVRQIVLQDESFALKIKNLNKNYWPQVNVNGQLSYQSEVTVVDINIPENPYFSGEDLAPPPVSKDWYKLTLDINQVIYDGGMTSLNKTLEETNLLLDKQAVEVELQQLKEMVNDVYFNILLLQERKKLLEVVRDELQAKLVQVESGVRNGILTESDADVLKAEKIRISQQLIEMSTGIETGMTMLQELTLIPISTLNHFPVPDIITDPSVYSNQRPEYELLALQQNRLSAMDGLAVSRLRPKLSGFGQLGYGRPGLNMLLNEFDPFYIFGARLTWNFWNWNQTKRERELLGLQKDIIETKKETFDKNLKVSSERYKGDIRKYEQLLQTDEEIIALRANVVRRASSQLDNGVITATDYMTEVNAETQARLDQETHRVMLVKAKVAYTTVLGK